MKILKLMILVAVMLMLLIVSANAAFLDQDKIKNSEAVEMDVALKVIKGRDGGKFDPQGQVTRAEMAKMICIIMNGGNEPSLGTRATSSFKDIKGHWAEPYIEYCTSLGIVSGIGNSDFNPDKGVTSTQAAKMLLGALGYDAEREQFNGANWFVKINAAANQKNLYDELTIDPNAPITRDDAAQMIWNALKASEIQYKPSTSNLIGPMNKPPIHEEKEGSLLKSKFNTDADCRGMMTSYRWDEDEKRFIYEIQDQGVFSSGIDYTNLFGLTVNVVHKNDSAKTIYSIYASKSKILDAGFAGDLEQGNSSNEIRFKKANYEIDYAISGDNPSPADVLGALPVYAENEGENPINYRATSLSTFKSYEVRLIDKDGNGKVDYIVYLPSAIGQVSDVNASSITIKDLKGFDINAGKTFIVLDRGRNQAIGNDIMTDDFVKIIPPQNTLNRKYQVLPLKYFEGTVTGTKDNKILVNQTWYDNGNNLSVLKDKTYIFYVDGSYLYYVEEVTGPTLDKLVYLQDAAAGTGNGVDAKLYFADGSTKSIPLKSIKLLVGMDLVTYNAEKFDYIYGPGPEERYSSFLKLAEGESGLYTYFDSNNGYLLTEVCKMNKVDVGDYAADATSASITPIENSKPGVLQMKGKVYTFADDAIVFVDGSDGVHVITGKKAKNFKTGLTNANAAALFHTDNGVNIVKAAIIKTSSPLPEDESGEATK